jgi:hypothetical protein
MSKLYTRTHQDGTVFIGRNKSEIKKKSNQHEKQSGSPVVEARTIQSSTARINHESIADAAETIYIGV